MRRQLSVGVIAGLGIATAQLTVYNVFTGAFFGLVGFLTDAILPLLFSVLLFVTGYWALTADRRDDDVVRLALWCLAGSVVITGFELFTAFSLYASGAAFGELLQALNISVARGAVLGVAFGLFDMERRRTRRREAELERQVERLEEFASVVSHDLRSPLTVAKGHIELIREDGDVDDDTLAHIEFAHDRMTEIIEDSLALARGGNEVTDPEPVELRTAAEQSWQIVGGGDGLTVTDDLALDADPERLKRILENLFRNSIEHAGEGSPDDNPIEASLPSAGESADDADDAATDGDTVSITVGALDDDAGFYLADDGPGIPEDERDDVFEAGVSGAEMGSGLGLAIVRRIAQAHGWTVSVTEAADGGARFEFRTDPA
jgi:signal transduction histidine kinase